MDRLFVDYAVEIREKWRERQNRKVWKTYNQGGGNKELLRLDRSGIRRDVKAVTNHCCLEKHLYTIAIVGTNMCGKKL